MFDRTIRFNFRIKIRTKIYSVIRSVAKKPFGMISGCYNYTLSPNAIKPVRRFPVTYGLFGFGPLMGNGMHSGRKSGTLSVTQANWDA